MWKAAELWTFILSDDVEKEAKEFGNFSVHLEPADHQFEIYFLSH